MFVALSVVALWSPSAGLAALGVLAGLVAMTVIVVRATARAGRLADPHRVHSFGWKPEGNGPAERPEPSSREIGGVLLLAISVRLGIALFVNLTSLWRSFAPDALAWEMWGRNLSSSWGEFMSGKYDDVVNPHVIVNAMVFPLFEQSRIPVSLLNAVFGITLPFLFGPSRADCMTLKRRTERFSGRCSFRRFFSGSRRT
ncbi:MAG: hypothetical protein HC927_04090 [Deltaproteobacteria bacterium]|nr:hypothetical protein [Deltaproteobacteria bacterium]